jgi:hypothetical protein
LDYYPPQDRRLPVRVGDKRERQMILLLEFRLDRRPVAADADDLQPLGLQRRVGIAQ